MKQQERLSKTGKIAKDMTTIEKAALRRIELAAGIPPRTVGGTGSAKQAAKALYREYIDFNTTIKITSKKRSQDHLILSKERGIVLYSIIRGTKEGPKTALKSYKDLKKTDFEKLIHKYFNDQQITWSKVPKRRKAYRKSVSKNNFMYD